MSKKFGLCLKSLFTLLADKLPNLGQSLAVTVASHVILPGLGRDKGCVTLVTLVGVGLEVLHEDVVDHSANGFLN